MNPPATPRSRAEPGLEAPCVLIVDDSESMRMPLREMLKDDGHRIDEAADGGTALALREPGFDQAQGFLLGTPFATDDLAALLQRPGHPPPATKRATL